MLILPAFDLLRPASVAEAVKARYVQLKDSKDSKGREGTRMARGNDHGLTPDDGSVLDLVSFPFVQVVLRDLRVLCVFELNIPVLRTEALATC